MSWLRRIWLLMLVLGTLVSPRLASAQTPLGLETRVGGLDLAAQVIVGVHGLASPGSYLGNPDGYDESASGCSLAARGAAGISGRVATRINLANGATRFTPLRITGQPISAGWNHVVSGHFGRAVANNRSVFSISQAELRTPLQSKQVVGSPVSHMGGGQFVRTVDVGRTVGTSSLRNGGGPTSVLKVFTDEAGNLITAFPL